MDQKHCKKCGVTKPLTEFYKNRSVKSGVQAYCKPCWGDMAAERYARNPDQWKANAEIWNAKNPDRVKANLERRKQRVASLPGGSFDSSRPDYQLRRRMFGDRCAYCSIKVDQVFWDHVIPVFLGEEAGASNYATNVVPTCRRCSASKSRRLLYTGWTPPRPLPPRHLYPAPAHYYTPDTYPPPESGNHFNTLPPDLESFQCVVSVLSFLSLFPPPAPTLLPLGLKSYPRSAPKP